jgi:uncharacterized membrane protein YkvA (DUF1232 family)
MQNPSSSSVAPDETESKRNAVSSILVGAVGVFSVIYLLNPTMGVIELIPDNFPIIGNLDEAAATAMLISALAYFGFDLGRLFGRGAKSSKDSAVDVEAEVVDRD